MLLSVIENIWDFILKQTTSGLSLDLIFYVGIGFTAIMVLFFIVKSYFAYEGRLERSLEKLNRWLFVHQQIDESNLVEFNNLIKKCPRLLRYHWQQYMLYREKEPSEYMSVYNCIEKPLHTSSYTANIKNFMNISIATMIVSFVLSFISFGSSAFTIASLSMPLITPAVIYIISMVCLFFLRMFQNIGLSSLYQNFHLFNRYIDKASTSIPKYVDFEILFTRQEIRGGIPVLNEYLEKRARQEAEELEKARENAIERETYDFSSTGIDGSLVLDRAMKESEVYLNARQRMLSEIRQYESEIDTLRKNYENTSKDYQRKLQASKENVERLRAQQEESTNRIEVNYIRKQQQDEIKKQEQLEKDQDSATSRYNQEVGTLTEQISAKKAELEEKRLYVQNAMLAEYQTFANKLFEAIQKDVSEKHKMEIDELSEQKVEVIRELEQAKEINQIKDSVIEDLKEMIKNNAVIEKVEQSVEEVPETAVEPETLQEEQQEEIVEGQVSLNEFETNSQETTQEEQVDEQPQGYYDDNGYYWYPNGTYYDNYGYYHDEQGEIYDSEGNYITPEDYKQLTNQQDEQEVQEETTSEQPASEPTEQTTSEDEQEQVEEIATEQIESKEQPEPEVEEEQQIALEEQPKVAEEQPKTEEVAQSDDVQEKIVSEQPASEPTEQTVVVSKKRGRPRKAQTENVEPKPAGKRGRPRKTETVTDKDEQTTAPKKRGRPRKNVEEAENKSVTPARRGRPRKVQTENVEQTTAPKKRGRPRKNAEEAESKPVTPARRGRPRKVQNESEPKPTGKRGRPRKVQTQNSEQTTAPKKRGRPRKQVSDAQQLQKINSQILEESNRLMRQQEELNKQLGETLNRMSQEIDDDSDE